MTLGQGTSPHLIYLNDTPYPVDLVQYNELATLLGKVTTGDFTRDSDEIMSSKIWSTWTGGMQVLNHRDGSDEGRYWIADLNTVYPYQLGPLRKVRNIATFSYPLGEIGANFYASNTSKQVCLWSEGGLAFGSTIATLTTLPCYRATEFKSKLYIPQSVGFQSFDGSAAGAQNTTVKAIAFAVWDTKLFAITSDNKLYSTPDGTTWTLEYTLDSSAVMRRITLWMDSSGEPALYVATTKGIYGWDDLAAKLVPTRMMMPPHADNGRGFCMWHPGEDLYFSAGMDVARFTGSAISPQQSGLSRDDGMPYQWRGPIVDLCPAYNAMYCLVDSQLGINLVLQFNGYGWHPVCTYDTALDEPVYPASSLTPTWLYFQGNNPATDLRLWWGNSNGGYTVVVPRNALNLREQIYQAGGTYTDFKLDGSIDLGWFDAGMKMFEKIASHVEVNFSIADIASDTNVRMTYMKDDATSWTTIQGDATDPDRWVFPLGQTTLTDGTNFAAGMTFKRLRLNYRFDFDSDEIAAVDSIVLKYIKRPQQVTSFTFSIRIPNQGHGGRSAQNLRDELRVLSTQPQFVRLRLGDSTDSYRVYLSRNNGYEPSGQPNEGGSDITVIHLPLEDWEGTIVG